ncbi:MAG: hypothetical protein HY959_00280 [Ignavibacteriae bacterium]|nr:hypothetical protein [Ignavibacteriota bacterium]
MENKNNTNNSDTVARLTALWALSEGFLGGFLHMAKIPLTGLMLGSVAVILMSLISKFSGKNGSILKATLIVLIVKGVISPYTPLTAYLAVSLQGILGELLFLNRKFPSVSSVLLGIIVSFFSSVQKVVFLTIIFGQNLWDSIDQFAVIVFKEFFGLINSGIAISKGLILVYSSVHVLFGLLGGIYAARLAKRADSLLHSYGRNLFDVKSFTEESIKKTKKSKHKRWWFKPSGIFFFAVTVTVFAFSYYYPELSGVKQNSVIIMLVRGILLMLIWYKFASPLLMLGFKKIMEKKKNKYTGEIENVVGSLPLFKSVVKFCWRETSASKGIKRIHRFFSLVLFNLLTVEPEKK